MNKKGFTLIELLAVITVLTIILLIAVPKVINSIQTSKENSFFSSAKSILRNIDYDNLETSILSSTSLSSLGLNISSDDYDLDSSTVYITDGDAYLTLVGAGKFEGLYICDFTLETTTNTVQTTSCV